MKNDNTNSTDDQTKKQTKVIQFPEKSEIQRSSGENPDSSIECRYQEETIPELGYNDWSALLGSRKQDSQAKAMVLLASFCATFFHTPELETYATIEADGIEKTISVESKTSEFWLSHLYYKATQNAPSPSSLKTAIRTLKAKALFDGRRAEVHLRYAAHDGCIYIYLGNETWEQVEISPDGRRVVSAKDSPIKFRREKGMAAMCRPAESGSLEPLREILNLESASDFKLIVAWLIGAMNPTGPFPIMTLVGEQGSSKSTTARFLKDLTDPATIDLVALPTNERELAIAAKKTWTLPYDNLSKLSSGLSDAFCRLATGGGFRTRTLYTNDSEMLFTSTRPVIMNGISDFITRQDLADRSIIINLAHIPKHKRIPEKQLQALWESSKPFVFAALCDALSSSLKNIGKVKMQEYPRMADFAQLVAAAEPALPWNPGEFSKAYSENIKKVIDISLEADDVAVAVMSLMDDSENTEWTGKASDLKMVLDSIVEDRVRRLKSWPKQANALSSRINRCSTFLRSKGIEIERGKSGDRYICIRKINDSIVHTAQSTETADDPESLSRIPWMPEG